MPDFTASDSEAAKDETMGLQSLISEDVKVETASTPYEPKTTVAENKSGRFIQYNGVGTVRIMDQASWSEADVDSDRYFEWNYLNQKRIPLEAFNDDELRYLLRVDGRFSIVEITE